MQTYGHFINGQWILSGEVIPVINKYTNENYAMIHEADGETVAKAIEVAKKTIERVELTATERYEIIMNASKIIEQRKSELANILVIEAGKSKKDALMEIERGIQTLIASGEEAKKLAGHGVALPNEHSKMAFTVRVPVGVIVAITPFNFPFNLTVHKIGPALAAGNAVVLKPAEVTPIIACKLAEIFKEAGLPDGFLNLVNGRGSIVGDYLLENPNVGMYTFTGSPKVGQYIKSKSGIRKVTLELGNNSPNIVHEDVADIEKAVNLCVTRGFSNAGQACISVQRIYVHENIYERFVELAVQQVQQLQLCSAENADADIGPVISEREAMRIESWIDEAKTQGAKVAIGGSRRGNFVEPTLLIDVDDTMKVVCEEVFGPVISIQKYASFSEAIERANNTTMGLQVGVFTSNIRNIMYSTKKLQFGGVIINNVSTYREDLMPYGGVKNSGVGKEGPAYAIQEMSEEKLIVLDY
ncbi:aldehyde dehydrogenase [[Bacillus] sp. KCTC 13219]|uniref:aldehyde dehydrogenase family protein n=1 Tax=Metasolibacillus fluoroglycofenilyticus TaxID=1239396 RepID=UPI000799C0AD|nr:aldehyde dehydrogenase family protein [Metasolibacillus fluoroglycofenilyticus]KYG89205.1 aldehyde dehydrogenase [[Bacillus] sp. KCTC 13219]